jgi:orotidine-5'-phosphate decarboxylase
MTADIRERLIFALDVDSLEDARRWTRQLRDRVGIFKVGKQLFTRCGPEVVRMIREDGGEVFLDLKYHDIPNTVAMAGNEAAALGVKIFNVHALGGREICAKPASTVRCRRWSPASPVWPRRLGWTASSPHHWRSA